MEGSPRATAAPLDPFCPGGVFSLVLQLLLNRRYYSFQLFTSDLTDSDSSLKMVDLSTTFSLVRIGPLDIEIILIIVTITTTP